MKLIHKKLLDEVSAKAAESPRGRMNHNFHHEEEPVNRLLNAMMRDTFFPVHRHLYPPKSESIIILRGRVAAFVFDASGRIIQKAIVDPRDGVYGFDVAPGEWHGLLVLEDNTVEFEVKPGPYMPLAVDDIAPWSPPANDPEAVAKFMDWLHTEIGE